MDTSSLGAAQKPDRKGYHFNNFQLGRSTYLIVVKFEDVEQ